MVLFTLLLSQIKVKKKKTYANISCWSEWISTAADLVTLRTPVEMSCWINVLEMLKRNFKQPLFSRRSRLALGGDHVKTSRAVTQSWIRLVNSCLFSQQVSQSHVIILPPIGFCLTEMALAQDAAFPYMRHILTSYLAAPSSSLCWALYLV